jgi:hypothetical protein
LGGVLTREDETCIRVLMLGYKRNQVEEAISHLLEPESAQPTQEMRTKLRRLLDTDRALPRSAEPDGANFAFFSNDPPGKGIENWFSVYEAFALLTGARLMRHGWPQGRAVSVMRRVRSELEEEHRRVLRHDPEWLFDQEAIGRNAKPGDPAFDNKDPVLLTVVSGSSSLSDEEGALFACKICKGPREALEFFWKVGGGGGGFTTFELTTLAHRLTRELAKTEPRSRGRG